MSSDRDLFGGPPRRRLTTEQEEICSVELLPGQMMAVNAFAGTGKTSTLEEYTRRYPHLRVLYMAFNKTAASDAGQRFPSSVWCTTTHALAFADVGRPYAQQLGEPKAKMIMAPLGIESPAVANHVIETLNGFLHSGALRISGDHLPVSIRSDRHLPPEFKTDIIRNARSLWAMMKDVDNKRIPMSHDGYLKLWQVQLSETGGVSTIFGRYNLVLLDEAQDTNPTMEAVVTALIAGGKHRVILVGDNRQNIYGFRGSVNLMERACANISSGSVVGAVKRLTESFRYTADIAKIATEILNADTTIKTQKVSVKGRRPRSDTKCGSFAIVGRSNGGIIAEAIAYLERNPKQKIHFAATTLKDAWNPTQLYRFEAMMSVYLYSIGRGNQASDGYIRQFTNYAEIVQHAKGEDGNGADRELDGYVRLVDQYGDRLPDLLDLIVQKCGPPDGVTCFSTAHRSKGLEWDDVKLLDDFARSCKMISFDDPTGRDRPGRDELNLLYVAATRARKHLAMHSDLRAFLETRMGPMIQEVEVSITTDPSLEVDDAMYDALEEVEAVGVRV